MLRLIYVYLKLIPLHFQIEYYYLYVSLASIDINFYSAIIITMRRILTEFYSLVYKTTGNKLLAYVVGLMVLALFNCVIVKGLAMLIQDWVGFAAMILVLFRFPIYFATFLLSLGAAYWFTPNIQTLSRDAKKNNKYLTIILYSLFAVVLFAYMQLGEVLFS